MKHTLHGTPLGETYVFGYKAVQEKAPNASGVYAIYTSRRWLYVGESSDIRQSLFELLNAPTACLKGRDHLSYSFEIVPATERVTRQRALAATLGLSAIARH